MTDGETVLVKAMLLASGHTTHEAEWMARSCPSMERARAVCSEDRRRTIVRNIKPSRNAIEIRHAHGLLREALGTPGEEAARERLVAAIRAARQSPERKPE